MRNKKYLPIIIVLILMVSVLTISLTKQKSSNEIVKSSFNNSTVDKIEYNSDNIEMRGAWITYMELSMETELDKSEKAFREKFSTIVKYCKGFGLNTLIVQVRPFCDALYNSKIFPYSHILTGKQGENPNYDALKIMCEICKENNLKIHAWVNPYRISISNTPNRLSNTNPYKKDSTIGIKTKGGTYLDPSNDKAINLIVDGVKEIVENYDVDGIQFDDYFYPTDIENLDSNQYNSYTKTHKNQMNTDDWRTANVNLLISKVYNAVHNTKRNVVFGISPQGNISNNKQLYADVISWCSYQGYIDYICPQIYFSLDNPALTFSDSLDSWCNIDYAENTKLYIGLAGYKAGSSESDNGTWNNSDSILAEEYEIAKNNKKVSGFMIYSYNSIIEEISKNEMQNLRNKLY